MDIKINEPNGETVRIELSDILNVSHGEEYNFVKDYITLLRRYSVIKKGITDPQRPA